MSLGISGWKEEDTRWGVIGNVTSIPMLRATLRGEPNLLFRPLKSLFCKFIDLSLMCCYSPTISPSVYQFAIDHSFSRSPLLNHDGRILFKLDNARRGVLMIK